MTEAAPRIGVALGSGAARGWAHIGVLAGLAQLGIQPQVIAGSSIGALVGGMSAAGQLRSLEAFARSVGFGTILRYLDPTWSSRGLIGGVRVLDWLNATLGERLIDDLPVSFGAVATDIGEGRAVWLREGGLVAAIRASISMPGFFAPVPMAGRWLADGGIVDPEPVGLARAMGADVVIAVRLNERPSRRPPLELRAELTEPQAIEPAPWPWLEEMLAGVPEGLQERAVRLFAALRRVRPETPRYLDVMENTVDIMAGLVSLARFAAHPADVVLVPRVGGIGVFGFNRASEAIAAGHAVVEEMAPAIRRAVQPAG